MSKLLSETVLFKWCAIQSVRPRDRTCTVLNVEGDAFGAGLLQYFVDRTSKNEEVTELTDVKLEGDPSVLAPEHSPLIEKQGRNDSAEGAKAALSESVM